ncbi:MAG: hypothetical protein JO336_10530, partial [Acidobacteriia bacterium]|nr:hypothetical protein [Terriglobia bacterium]
MKKRSKYRAVSIISRILRGAGVCAILAASVFAQANNPCPRFAAGGLVPTPPNLFSDDGVLRVTLAYQTFTDSAGRILYCFT